MNNLNESPVFCTTRIEELNDYIQKEIDSRLYFAAYYSPKLPSANSNEYNFWCGITNLYGLFKDCSIQKELLLLFKESHILEEKKFKEMNEFIYLIKSFRSIFSHNSSEVNIESYEQYKKLVQFAKGLNVDLSDELPYKVSVCDEEWFVLLQALCEKTDKYMMTINAVFQSAYKSDNKEKLISEWINMIAKWYAGNRDILHNAIKYYYQLAIISRKTVLNQSEWIKKIKDDVKQTKNLQAVYIEYILKSTNTALPLETVSVYLKENFISL